MGADPKTTNLATRIFDNGDLEAVAELEAELRKLGVLFDHSGWDDYDSSLELYGVPADHRLSADAQKVIHGAGFIKAYVNHIDKWETHHSFSGDFKPNAWRVSYPHKRGEGETGIWVESDVPAWPRDWFETGYVIVKEPAHGS